MTPERWQQVKNVFHSALEHESSHRALFLDEACAGDVLLRKEVESLIASHERTGSFIDSPAYELGAELLTEDHAELAVGQRVAHYEILALLGAGGMGEVYLAHDTRLGREIALKLLPAQFTTDGNRLRRFEQEARVASALNHPNICMIHEVGETEDDRHYIAMEYVDGVTLSQHLTETRMQIGETLDVATQVGSALAAAHEAGIVHRDIKPENIMLRRDGYIKVLDFGLAKLTEQPTTEVTTAAGARVKTDTGVVMGTSSYMSPEQARGLAVDARTDIWSLGVVLSEMVTGSVPFEGATTSDVIVSILEREPPPLAQLSPEAPAELQRIVSKTLHKDRDERYQTASELLTDLRGLKQRLEFETELERSKPLGASSRPTTITHNRQSTIDTAVEPATRTNEAAQTPTRWSAEYLIGQFKRYRGRMIALTALTVTVGCLALLFYFVRTGKPIDSIAVLPFVNVSGDPNTEYLADGITESTINSLSHLPRLAVIARSAVFRYKGREIDPQAVARELKVQAVLMGRVVQRGDNLQISAELLDASNNHVLWTEQYSRKLADLLGVQSEISRDISEQLRRKLSPEEERLVTKRYPENAEAYQLYLKGRYYWYKRNEESLKKSLDYFQQAIEKDPNGALAYAGLADTYDFLGETLKAKEAVLKALELDDTLADAHASLGRARLFYDWNFADAEKEFKRAIVLNPNSAQAHHYYSHYLIAIGRFDESLTESKRAFDLEPLTIVMTEHLGFHYYYAHQFDRAIEHYGKTIEMEPNFAGGHAMLGAAYEQKGMFDEAIAEFQKANLLSQDFALALAGLGHVYAVSGKRGAALEILDKLRSQERPPAYEIAQLYAGVGDKDQAFAWLERAYEKRSQFNNMTLKVEPKLDSLHSDPRFTDLLRRIGLHW
jgi:eukaryotic-like serine/threonine-protein kinase